MEANVIADVPRGAAKSNDGDTEKSMESAGTLAFRRGSKHEPDKKEQQKDAESRVRKER